MDEGETYRHKKQDFLFPHKEFNIFITCLKLINHELFLCSLQVFSAA